MSKIIEVKNLCKSFDKKVIFANVNLSFYRGECTAILGSNGSGKSTFIRMLCGLCTITDGTVIKEKQLKFNYIPENYSKITLTADEYLKAMGDIENLAKDILESKLSYLYSRFNFKELKNVPMKNLSKGSLQKTAIMQAFIGKCDVLLLDEPMTGLDVNSQQIFIEEVKNLIKDGTTVIMSCHESFLVNKLCTRVLKISNKNIMESKLEECEERNTLIFKAEKNEYKELETIIKNYGEYNVVDNKLKIEADSSKSNKILFELLKRGYILEKFV